MPWVWPYGQVSSVLDVAARLLKNGHLAPFDSVVAKSQTQGRGQMRRTWFSPSGNVYAALRLPYEVPFCEDSAAPALGALLSQAFKLLGLEVKLKWPNDLVFELGGWPHKFGGILLEERRGTILAGIGLNYRFKPDPTYLRSDAQLPVTSMLDFAPKMVNASRAEDFWAKLVNMVISTYKDGEEFKDRWRDWFQEAMVFKGRQVEVGDLCQGKLLGLGSKGGLLLSYEGEVQEVLTGSLRLKIS
ncbi:MAG: biotin--acetyl-CoA-carboxylase ligase [Desulfovibrionaceae bacterium]|nr:biotin--acetyl-CoA-carboxylase ligase [Desulfovibrionaceae bacterium]